MKRREFYKDGVRQIDSSDFPVAYVFGLVTIPAVLLAVVAGIAWLMMHEYYQSIQESIMPLPYQLSDKFWWCSYLVCVVLIFSLLYFEKYWKCRNQEYFLADFPGSRRWVVPLLSFVGLPFYIGSYLRMRRWEKDTNYQPRDFNEESCANGEAIREDITISMSPVDLSPVFDDFVKYYRTTEAKREVLERQELSHQTEFVRRRADQYSQLATKMHENVAYAERAEGNYQPAPPLAETNIREELQRISRIFGVRGVQVVPQGDQLGLHITARLYTISRDGTYYLGDYRIEIDQFCNVSCVCTKSGARADYQEANPGRYCQNASVELPDLMNLVIEKELLGGNIAQAVNTLLTSLQGTIVEGSWKNLQERFKRVIPAQTTEKNHVADQSTEKDHATDQPTEKEGD